MCDQTNVQLTLRYAAHIRNSVVLLSTDEEQLIILLFKVRVSPQPFIFPEFDFIVDKGSS